MTGSASRKTAKKAPAVTPTPNDPADVAEAATAAPKKSGRAAPKEKTSEAKAKAVEAAPADGAAKGKAKRTRKEKVVRDSFTMPKSDYEKLTALKQRCLDAGVVVKKSELLRAGLILLEAASAKRLVATVSALETVKTGRPASSE